MKLRANGISPTMESARTLLGDENHLGEIEKSYWRYLSVWEKEEWAQLKEEYKNAPRSNE